jgi:hypothetical protein
MRNAFLAAFAAVAAVSATAHAQYNRDAAKSAPAPAAVTVETRGADGSVEHHTEYRAPARDHYGNAAGNQYDLAVDGAFKGQTVAVLHLYTGEGFDFSLPKAALAQKGLSVYRWINAPPPPRELAAALKKSCQLWIISGAQRQLSDEHIKIIKDYFDAGHGVYIWGDNEPFYADANAVAEALLGAKMLGNLPGAQTVGLQHKGGRDGILPNHLLSTGLEHLYEGVTIATIQPNQALQPLLYGSAGNLVTAFYDRGGKRAILDGGFTRLYISWDDAGTARYVKNAAAWLVNYERFGDSVVANDLRQDKRAKLPN